MLRKKGWFVAVLCCALMMATACLTYAAAAPAGRQPIRAQFAGSSPGGVWYMVMSGVSECISKSFPGSAITVVPGDGVSNANRIATNQCQIGMSHSIIVASALAGNDPFPQKFENIAPIASLYSSELQFVALKKLGISSYDDIFTKKAKVRISIDNPGSTAELTFKRLFGEYGINYDAMKKWGGDVILKNMGDSSDMMSDGLLDGFGTMTLNPAAPIQESALNKELVMIPLSKEMQDRLVQKFGYSRGVVPANSYKFNPTDMATVASYTVIAVPKNAPDELAYNIALSLKENLDYMRNVHTAMKNLTVEKMIQNLGGPLHKGAEKYYREIGVLK